MQIFIFSHGRPQAKRPLYFISNKLIIWVDMKYYVTGGDGNERSQIVILTLTGQCWPNDRWRIYQKSQHSCCFKICGEKFCHHSAWRSWFTFESVRQLSCGRTLRNIINPLQRLITLTTIYSTSTFHIFGSSFLWSSNWADRDNPVKQGNYLNVARSNLIRQRKLSCWQLFFSSIF